MDRNHALQRADGDTWEDQATHDLFEKLLKHGTTIASEGSDGGWGHHSITAVVRFKRQHYVVQAGGCSCDGSGSIAGPMTKKKALKAAGSISLGDNVVTDG